MSAAPDAICMLSHVVIPAIQVSRRVAEHSCARGVGVGRFKKSNTHLFPIHPQALSPGPGFCEPIGRDTFVISPHFYPIFTLLGFAPQSQSL